MSKKGECVMKKLISFLMLLSVLGVMSNDVRAMEPRSSDRVSCCSIERLKKKMKRLLYFFQQQEQEEGLSGQETEDVTLTPIEVKPTEEEKELKKIFCKAPKVRNIKSFLLRHNVYINKIEDTEGYTMLHIAADEDNVQLARVLIKSGAFLDVKNFNNLTPLALARSLKNKKVGDYLQLHTNLFSEKLKVVKAALKAGAYVHVQNCKGHTPLIVASAYHCIPHMYALIHAGADVNAKDGFGCSALDYVERADESYKWVKQILQTKADFTEPMNRFP